MERGEWFMCLYCNRPAGVYPKGGGPLYGEPGEVSHLAPSCDYFRRMSGEEFTKANANRARITIPNELLLGVPAQERGS